MMYESNEVDDWVRPAAQVVRCDLCAQVTPLDRYGLPGFSAALVDGLRALFSVSRGARLHSLLTKVGAPPVPCETDFHSCRVGARSSAEIDRKPPIQEPSAAKST